jgi:excisionase family DNA binding protein
VARLGVEGLAAEIGPGVLGVSRDIGGVDGQMQLGVAAAPPQLSEPLLTPMQAAELLAVRRSWVYDAARQGELPCIRVGRHVRFLRSDLERWVSAHRR